MLFYFCVLKNSQIKFFIEKIGKNAAAQIGCVDQHLFYLIISHSFIKGHN